jgi:hypothetical protein
MSTYRYPERWNGILNGHRIPFTNVEFLGTDLAESENFTLAFGVIKGILVGIYRL